MTIQNNTFNDDLELSGDESAILARILKGELTGNLEQKQDKIRPRDVFSPIPQSFSQQRVWILDRLVPGSAFYNLPSAIRLKGRLDAGVLELSLNEVIRRHESLRTVFSMVDEEPVQVILPELTITITPIDLIELAPEVQDSEVSRRLREEARSPFDLQEGPLLRVILLQLGERDYVLLLNMHHIISDSWSMGLFIKELSIFHAAFSGAASSPSPSHSPSHSPLPQPGLQYGDYAVWQRQWLKGDILEKQLAYWRELLGGDLPILALPTDRQRPAISTYLGGTQSFKIPESLTAKLLGFNRQENCSLFMSLLTAFNVLLCRYSGQEDILVGSPIANRNREELEEIIGFFANTLVYRTDLSGNPTFRRLLAQVNDMTTRAYDNQDIPFEKLVEELHPQRFMSHNPLFQVMFVLQNVPRHAVDVGSLDIQHLTAHTGTSKFDLWLSVTQSQKNLTLTFEYSYDIFADRTITRLFGHFQALLEAITRDAGCSIHLLEILPEEEKKQLLIDFNNTDTEYPRDKTIPGSFMGQAEKSPDGIALVGADRCARHVRLTYSELNEHANRWAQLLMQKGVGPDTIVAVMLERSIELVITLLAILKAGGAYLPIDPDYPQERIDYMLKDSNAKIIVGNRQACSEELNCQLSIVNCELLMSAPREPFHHSPFIIHHSNQLSYVIYTSGSTGEPKGAMISHEGISNRLYWMQETFCLHSEDRILQKTPYSFDVSVWEFFWPLLTGAGLVMAVPGGHKDCAYLARTIMREKITTIHFVPSALQVFLEEPGVSGITSLKRVICSGEALPLEYQERFFALFANVELHNLYGPTEASVDVTAWSCERKSNRHSVPIGRPIANTQIYILDKYLNPVPIGVHGELYIGGIQVARGYINRPELTAEKFGHEIKKTKINKRFSGGPGGRFFKKAPLVNYKTGDRVRWQEDGNIEFIGRLDFQVKVRGFRIELGEIEARLREHHAVHDAVVLANGDDDNTGAKKLTAYIVPDRNYGQQLTAKKEDLTTGLTTGHVDDWQGVFDEAYVNNPGQTDPAFNIAGWNSSYTGAAIPAVEMKEWVDRTTERIVSLAPQRVLEIGCGTGLFLFQLIKHCRYYVGTDIAKQGLDYIRRQVDRLPAGQLGQNDCPVELLHRSAENFEGMEDRDLDMVIMNSVSQYFPTAEYLVDVLSKAAQNIRPGGHIFIGDVRNLSLLKTFHASVEFSRAGDGDRPRQVLGRVMNKLAAEQELVVEPRFFIALKAHLPQIKHVELRLKYGRYCNELSKFRYDVILHIGNGHDHCHAGDHQPEFILDWETEKPGLDGIRQWLNTRPGEPSVLAVKGIWNPRIFDDFQILKWLTRTDRTGNAGEFRCYLAAQKKCGIEPDDVLQLAEEFPYHISAVIALQGEAHTYDIIFRRRNQQYVEYVGENKKTGTAGSIEIHPWYSYTNNPLLRKMTGEWVPQWREYLKERLPEYMTPSHFILLDSLPLTANGKLDRGMLPLYEPSRTALEKEHQFVEPTTATGQMLVELWKELLLLDKVSIHDNFFQLGGDSINAIQLISRMNKKGFNLSVSQLYRNMTVAEFAHYIDTHWQEVTVSGQVNIPIMETKINKEDILRRLPAGVEIEDIYPLTPLQRHMLAYYLRDKQGTNEPGLYVNQVRMLKTMDKAHIPLLIKAFQHLTGVYPYLRTAFMWEHIAEPVQVVYKNAPVDIQSFDWSYLPPGERDRRVEDFIVQDHYRGFERNNPVADRITIIALSQSESLIIKTSDLMRVDGWSAMIITTKLFEYIRGLSMGQVPKLEANTHYREYITWLSAQDQTKGKEFWQTMIKGEGCAVPTPLVEWAPRNQNIDGKKIEEPGFHYQYIYLSSQQTTELNDFLKQNQIVLSALACGIWALLLAHYTGQENVIFGILFSGRGVALAGVETMIGQAINILPLRIDLSWETSILTWLQQIWANLVALQPYEINQIDKICEWWHRPPGQPLFESYLVVENFPGIKEKSKINASGRPNFEYIAQMEYPLRVEFQPGPEIGLVMQYYRRHFTTGSIAAMMNDLQTLLREIIKNPNQNLDDLQGLIGQQ